MFKSKNAVKIERKWELPTHSNLYQEYKIMATKRQK